MLGIPSPKGLTLTATPSSLNNSSENATVYSLPVTITQKVTARGEAFRHEWRQLSGPPGTVIQITPTSFQFGHPVPADSTVACAWRCTVNNQFGLVGTIDVAFSVNRYTPVPALSGWGSPSSNTIVYINPTTRLGTCHYSAGGVGGVPPYTYDWGGGDYPTSAANQNDIYLAPGATEGINFGPVGCRITDSIGQTLVVGAGPFFVMEA